MVIAKTTEIMTRPARAGTHVRAIIGSPISIEVGSIEVTAVGVAIDSSLAEPAIAAVGRGLDRGLGCWGSLDCRRVGAIAMASPVAAIVVIAGRGGLNCSLRSRGAISAATLRIAASLRLGLHLGRSTGGRSTGLRLGRITAFAAVAGLGLRHGWQNQQGQGGGGKQQ